MKKLIFCAGFGYTGSGAVLDMLSEVNNVHVMANEFRVLADPDGLLSLRRSLTRDWSLYGADRALNRFERMIKKTSSISFGPYALLDHTKEFRGLYVDLSKEFVSQLSSGDYRGYWYGNDNLLLRLINSRWFFGKFSTGIFKKRMRIVPYLDKKEFDKKAQAYIQKLAAAATNKTTFCFDEGFIALHCCELLEMIPDSKLILTIRNPKDVIATTTSLGWNANPDKLSMQIEWLYSTYNRWMQIAETQSPQKVLVVKLEDMVNEYERTKKRIFEYLQIEDIGHLKKYDKFDPAVSKQNVNIAEAILSNNDIKEIDTKFFEINQYFKYR